MLSKMGVQCCVLVSICLVTLRCAAAQPVSQDRLITSMGTVLDPLALVDTTGIKLSDFFAVADRSAIRVQEKRFFRASPGKRGYGSILVSDNVNSSLVFVHIHGGFLTVGDRYDVSAWIVSLAKTLNAPLVTIDYALDRQRGWTLTQTRNHIDATVNATQSIFSSAKIVLVGVSAGGTLALDAADRRINGVDGVIADSPNICGASLGSDLLADDNICWRDKTVDPDRLDFVIQKLEALCFDNTSFAIPVFISYPSYDLVIPEVQFQRFVASHLPDDFCKDSYGVHGNSVTLMGCLSKLSEWLERHFDRSVDRFKYTQVHGSYNLREAFAVLYQSVLPLSLTCRQLCYLGWWDPILAVAQKCGDVKEITVPP